MNAGYSFLGLVVAAGLIGFGIDKFFATQPWGLLIFLIIGFVYATYQAQKSMSREAEDSASEKDDKKP